MAAYDALLSLAQTTDLNSNQDEHRFSFNDKEKIRSIHEYVVSLLWFLKDYPEKVNRRLEGKIREVAHKAEDIIEHLMLQRIESTSSRFRFEEQLENVTEEIGLIAGEVTEERPAIAVSSSPIFPPTAGGDAVIGLDDDLMAMKMRLCGESSNLQVIPIVGMGGIGKTTLARTVYHHPLIIERFEIRAWVAVSQNYSPRRFWKTLLGLVDSMKLLQEQFSGDEIDESKIALQVFKILKRRRYLIILDDVWGTQVWDDVRDMFPDDDNGSRIMFTTRKLDVAAYPDPGSPLHEMRFMNDSHSWDLLKENVFTNRNCPPDLEDIGKEIARRCAGLPLAIVLVAGILSPVNETRASWEEFAKTVNPVVDREIEEILSLSYANLPHHLRPCFLLFGGFLEDVEIRTSRLIRLWVAEGFLFLKHQNGCSKSLEEEGEVYLEDLVKRNLVMVISRKSNGKIKSCSLHDMVRALCIRKAQEEKFLLVMDGRDLPQGMINERRICFSRSDIDDIWGPTIRTILCFQIQNSPSWLASLGRYKLPRILDALGVVLKELPSQVFELYHLRYLALMGSLKIPSSISNLVNLQTLIIHLAFGKLWRRYNKVVSHPLPLEIWRMPQLRHLVFYAPSILPNPPDGLNPLENLQTLLLVIDLVWTENILQMIPNIKRLGLVYEINLEYNLHHLKYLHQLEKLEVTGYHSFSWRWQNPTFPRTLKKLTLMGGGFPWEHMGIIGSLPNLQVLKLLDFACDGETWITADEEFPQLEFLMISNSHLRQWITQSSHFPRLKCIVLRSCWYLAEIPEDIGEVSALELIEVGNCGQSLVESAKKIKDDQVGFGNDALQVHVNFKEIQSCYKQINPSSVELEDQLKNVTQKIGLIAGEMMGTPVPPAFLPVTNSSSSRLAPTGKVTVIGIHDDLKAIKDLLCGLSSKLQVIPIVGTGGIGKTTLARTVYNDPLIMKHFQICAWVTVSHDYSPQEILLHLLHSMELLEEHLYQHLYKLQNKSEVAWEVYENLKRQILGDEIDESKMAEKVSKNLKGRRYLIVMDDVWSTKVWDDVRNVFPDDGNGSRILFTTRLSDVAAHPDAGSPLHEMRFMDDYKSWELLKQKVFTNSNCPPDLEDVGKEIARRCTGLPLAVVLVAGVLSQVNKTRASWEEIAKTVNPVVDQEIEEILSLSYTHLPHHLRPCFLFIRGFPEDANIRASNLIRLWVAEGFLKHRNGCSKSLEDKAEEYLEDLVERNLVIVTGRKSNGKIKSCSLHDMVRDLCIRKAQEEKLLHVMDSCEQCTSFSCSDIDNIWGSTTRTILCFHLNDLPIWLAFSGGFRLLKAMDDVGDRYKELPSQVFELFNLRYLSLNAFSKIPLDISNLTNLQTLIIHPTIRQHNKRHQSSYEISLPLEIWRMPQLRHLILDAPYMLPLPPNRSNLPLENLQTLFPVKNLVWNKKILEMIPNVKRLGLVHSNNQEYHLHHLKDLLQLEKLELVGGRDFSWQLQKPSFSRTLKKLTLRNVGCPWRDMGIIGSLPNLQVLKLLDQACHGETWETTDEEFPQLNFLLIQESSVRRWIAKSSHFPRLKCLVLHSCRNLMTIPKGIGKIPTLELVEVVDCTESVEKSAKEIKEDQESSKNYALQIRFHANKLREHDKEQTKAKIFVGQLHSVREKVLFWSKPLKNYFKKKLN